METTGFDRLPNEVLDLVFRHLSYSDYSNLEQTSKQMLEIVEKAEVWKKAALEAIRTSDIEIPLVRDSLKYMNENGITDAKFYKILIAVTKYTRKVIHRLKEEQNQLISRLENHSSNFWCQHPEDIKEEYGYYEFIKKELE